MRIQLLERQGVNWMLPMIFIINNRNQFVAVFSLYNVVFVLNGA
ncbi:hypothetical protein VVMO6_00220 [Vibrio vulnificus MO6-24/O]|nr:hypothetical protein VVMO6_00220 [Vibrio vulnificus MO6-24/O]